MTDLGLWQFTPLAPPEDSRWLSHRPVRALYVAASTPAQVRLVAAHADVPQTEGKVGNESGHAHSRFRDEKLYRVDPAPAELLARYADALREPAVVHREEADPKALG